jgi:O-antigen ligase
VLLAVRVTLVSALLLFLPGQVEIFEAPKASLLRVCGAVALGLALGRPDAFRRARWQPLDLAVAAWVAVELLATMFSESPLLSVVGEPDQRGGLLTSLALAGVYLCARLGTRDAADARGTLDALLCAAAITCSYGVLQALGLDPMPWRETSEFIGFVRPFGTLGNPNLLGVIGAAVFCAALARAALEPPRRLRFAGAALLAALATLLTVSRGAWAASALGGAATAVLAWRAGAAEALSRRAALLVVAAMAAFVAFAGLSGTLRARFAGMLAPAVGSEATRVEIWRAGLAAWRASPWLGHGPDTFALVYQRYQTPRYWRLEWAGLPVHAHSIYVQALATRGALGLAAVMAAGLAAAWALRSAWLAPGGERAPAVALASAMLGALVAGAVGALGICGALLLAACAGTLAALAQGPAPTPAGAPAAPTRRRAEESRRREAGSGTEAKRIAEAPRAQRRLRRPPRRRAWLPAAVLGLVALAWSAADVAGWREARRAERLTNRTAEAVEPVRRAALREAAEDLRSAARWMPADDALEIRRTEALIRYAAVSPDSTVVLREAERAARRAVAIGPRRPFNHQRLGSVLLERAWRGDTAAVGPAESAYAQAFALAPQNVLAVLELGGYMMALRRYGQAFELARRAAALYPDEGFVQWRLAQALAANGRLDEARAVLDRALATEWGSGRDERTRAEQMKKLLLK